MEVDIAVIGAGPAGSLIAQLLGRNYRTIVIEEHQTPGFPVQCAGLVSEDCFRAYSKYCKIERCVENEIRGALFFSPNGEFVEAKGKAYVIDRRLLDLYLFYRAAEFSETIVKSKVRFKGNTILAEREISAEYIVGADGVYSATARYYGFERPRIFSAVQIETKFEPMDENFVELYFGEKYSDGFFAYAVPIGDTAKLGVISRKNPNIYLRKLIENHPSVSKRVKSTVLEFNCGAIPANLVDFVKNNVALIGDSAGMVKPYTGGGLFYIVRAAEKLAENFPNLEAYKESYLSELGKEHEFGGKIQRLYSVLTDAELNKLVRLFKEFDFSGVDMDRPSTLLSKAGAALRLLRSPSLAFKIFGTLLF